MLSKAQIASLLELHDANNIQEFTSDFSINKVEVAERDRLILDIVQRVYHGNLRRSGEHRFPEWEIGWSENLEKYMSEGDLEALVPGYFSTNTIIRLGGDLYRASSSWAEPELLGVLIFDILKNFCTSLTHVYEFGCGSGNNLRTIRRALPDTELTGLDWATASQRIISVISEKKDIDRLNGRLFNFFDPDYSFKLSNSGAVFTCAALEQVGSNWRPFVDYLIAMKPGVIINIEPISELLDEDKLLDFLSAEYARKRNHLCGYFDGLLELEKTGQIKILHKKRSSLGSLYLNGYSVVIWEVC